MDGVREVVSALYRFFLLREPDAAGLAVHTRRLVQSTRVDEEFLEMLKLFSSSEEFMLKCERFVQARLSTSGVPGRSVTLKLLADRERNPEKQTDLLVSGTYRAGTSALVSLLNFSPDVLVTHEMFDTLKARSWMHDAFVPHYHLGAEWSPSIDVESRSEVGVPVEVNANDRPELRRLFPEVEFGDEFSFPSRRVLPGAHLLEFGLEKRASAVSAYSTFKLRGDKYPVAVNVSAAERMLANPHLSTVCILRDPRDVLRSALQKVKGDPSFADFSSELFVSDMMLTYSLIKELAVSVPRRTTIIRYEGFFTDVDRIRALFSRLGVDGHRVHVAGIQYMLNRAVALENAEGSAGGGQENAHVSEDDFASLDAAIDEIPSNVVI